MSIDEDFLELSEYLAEIGLSWIVDEVNEVISTGVFVEDTFPTLKEDTRTSQDAPIESRFKKATAAEYTRRMDFSPLEKMEILLNAIQTGIVEPLEVERQALLGLGENIEGISFVSEDDSETLRIDRNRVNFSGFPELEEALKSHRLDMGNNND